MGLGLIIRGLEPRVQGFGPCACEIRTLSGIRCKVFRYIACLGVQSDA